MYFYKMPSSLVSFFKKELSVLATLHTYFSFRCRCGSQEVSSIVAVQVCGFTPWDLIFRAFANVQAVN